MKPERANLYAVNTTGRRNDIIFSFFYEWMNTEDGKNVTLEKQKVSSVVLDIGDFMQFADTVQELKKNLEDVNERAKAGELN